MPSRAPRIVLLEIDRHLRLAAEFVEGMAFDDFVADRKTIYAVIRCLEIISEASRRLPDELKTRHVELPWTDIAGAGNVYRHDYEDVDDRIIWNTVVRGLEPLRLVVQAELARDGKSGADGYRRRSRSRVEAVNPASPGLG